MYRDQSLAVAVCPPDLSVSPSHFPSSFCFSRSQAKLANLVTGSDLERILQMGEATQLANTAYLAGVIGGYEALLASGGRTSTEAADYVLRSKALHFCNWRQACRSCSIYTMLFLEVILLRCAPVCVGLTCVSEGHVLCE